MDIYIEIEAMSLTPALPQVAPPRSSGSRLPGDGMLYIYISYRYVGRCKNIHTYTEIYIYKNIIYW